MIIHTDYSRTDLSAFSDSQSTIATKLTRAFPIAILLEKIWSQTFIQSISTILNLKQAPLEPY